VKTYTPGNLQKLFAKFAPLFLFFTLLSGLASAQNPVLEIHMDKDLEERGKVFDTQGHHADNYGVAYVPDRFGIPCRAMYFDGKSHLSIPSTPDFNIARSFGLSVWCKVPPSDFQWLTLICKGDRPGETTNMPTFRAQFTEKTASVNTNSTPRLGDGLFHRFPTDKWFHVVVNYDGTSLEVYIDGVKTYSYVYSDPMATTNNAPLHIGRDVPGNEEFFEGIMDELMLFDAPLSPKKIKKIYSDDSRKKLKTACPNTGGSSTVTQTPANPLTGIDLTPTDPTPEENTTVSTTPTDPSGGNSTTEETPPPTNPLSGIDLTSTEIEPEPEITPVQNNPPTNPSGGSTTETETPSGGGSTVPPVSLPAEPEIQHEVTLKSAEVEVVIFDHGIVDNDTVSFFMNEERLLNRVLLPDQGRWIIHKVKLEPNKVYNFTVLAHNFGSDPNKVNTVGIRFNDGLDLTAKKLVIKDLDTPVAVKVLYKKE